MKLARYRKTAVAVLGALAIAAAELPPGAPEWLQRSGAIIIAIASAVGVYAFRNAPPPSAEALLARRARESKPAQ